MIIKGKALTMVREFLKVYPKATEEAINKRIKYEVAIGIDEVYGETLPSVPDVTALENIVVQISKEVIG